VQSELKLHTQADSHEEYSFIGTQPGG
jgi:hypothetical protein